MFINEHDKDRLLDVEKVSQQESPKNTRSIIGAIADFLEQDSELRDQFLALVLAEFVVDDVLDVFNNLR
jgi:hypothetical protein